MSDNGMQSDTDLFGSEETDASADAGKTQTEDELLPEESTQTEPTAKPAEIQAQKNVAHWVDEITSGRKSIDDLPRDKQWLKSRIEAELKVIAKEPDIDAKIEERLLIKEEQRAYKALVRDLNSMNLTRDQKATIKSELEDLKSNGLSDFKALEKAAKIAGVSLDAEDRDRMILRQRMALPAQGTRPVRDSNPKVTDEDFFKANDPQERMKVLMQAYRGK